MADVDELLALVQRQQARIDHLERVLAANNIHVPVGIEVGEDTLRQPASMFPVIDLSEPPPKEPRRIDAKAFVEDLPRICESLFKLWGAHGFDEYLNRLIIDERGTRQGFSTDVMEELLFLGRISRGKARLIGTQPPVDHPKVR